MCFVVMIIGYFVEVKAIRRAVHSSHIFLFVCFGEITNFSISSHQNVLYSSVTIAYLKWLLQLNFTAHFGDFKQENG